MNEQDIMREWAEAVDNLQNCLQFLGRSEAMISEAVADLKVSISSYITEHSSADIDNAPDEDLCTIEGVRSLKDSVSTASREASTALEKASGAETNVNNVRNTADAAQRKSAQALDAAEDAFSSAQAASESAETAARKATEAVTKAEEAKEKAEAAESTVDQFEEGIVKSCSGTLMALDIAGLAARDIDAQKYTRNQVIEATIINRGVIDGLELSKSTTATRNLSATDGRIFMAGREYPVLHQSNTAHIDNNTTSSVGTVIIYLKETDGVMEIESTPLNEPMPEDCIEIARCTIPAGNTENNDPYLHNVSIIDTARREPGWPTVQMTPGQVYVPLNRVLSDTEYMVDVEVESASSFYQLGSIMAISKRKNGFSLMTNGNADTIKCRCHVKHPSHPCL